MMVSDGGRKKKRGGGDERRWRVTPDQQYKGRGMDGLKRDSGV